MPFPKGWPPRRTPQGNGGLRFYVRAVATANFADRAYLFSQQVGSPIYAPLPVIAPGSSTAVAIPPWPGGGKNGDDPEPMAWSTMIRVVNEAPSNLVGDLEVSFDGATVHGVVWNSFLTSGVYETTMEMLYERCEAGIAVRGTAPGVAVPFRIEAW
jgi:hypothetical protein